LPSDALKSVIWPVIKEWMPAFAGMTEKELAHSSSNPGEDRFVVREHSLDIGPETLVLRSESPYASFANSHLNGGPC
jgi:hypothetical protein